MIKKFPIFAFGFVSLLLLGGSVLVYRVVVDQIDAHWRQQHLETVSTAKGEIATKLSFLMSDLRFLSQAQSIRSFLANAPNSRENLERVYSVFAQERAIYSQVRFLDLHGQELVRINCRNRVARVVAHGDLQNKSDRYYFADAIVLDRGQVYISPMDLNIERGVVERPFSPTIRVATPVFDETGAKRGLLVLNYNASELLVDFLRDQEFGEFQLLNADGYWLRHQEEAKEWGFMLNEPEQNMAKKHPEAWRKMLGASSGEFSTQDGDWTFVTENPIADGWFTSPSSEEAAARANAASEDEVYFWKIAVRMPAEKIAALHLGPLIATTVGGGAAQLGLFAFCLWAANARRLRQDAAEKIEEGQRRYHALFENGVDGIFVVDVETAEIIEANHQALRLVGKTREELQGTKLTLLHPPRQSSRVAELLKIEEDCHEELEVIGPRGGPVAVESSFGSIIELRGQRVCIATYRDITERRQTAERLRTIEERLRQFAEFGEDIVWIVDLRPERLIFLSPSFEGVFGLSISEMANNPRIWLDRVHGEDAVRIGRRYEETTSQDVGAFQEDFRISTAQGDARWVSLKAKVILGADKMPMRFSGLARDITSQKRAEEVVRESERRFRDTFNALRLVVVSLNVDGRINYVNPAMVRLLGHRREELIGADWFGLSLPSTVAPRVRALFLETVRDGTMPPSFENEIMTRDGARRTILWANTSLRDTKGEVIGTVSIGEDVTENRAAAQAVLDAKMLLQTVLDTVPIDVWVSDIQGRITLQSQESIRFWGDMRGQLIEEAILDTAVSERLMQAYRVALSGQSFRREQSIVWRGAQRILISSVTALQGADGVRGVIGVNVDVTATRVADEQRHQIEQQMLQTQKLESLGILAGGVAHDFNNLLTAILGNADLALLDLPENSPAAGAVEEVATVARRAAELCRQMLAYSGKGKFIVELVDICRLTREMLQMLRVSISRKVTLKLDLPERLPAIEADASQIRQVMMNLIINASEAIAERDGSILISARSSLCTRAELDALWSYDRLSEGTYVVLSVSDNGSGMKAETLAHIFEPFFTTKFEGRGLGLAAVQGIVRAHKGAIRVRSSEGVGTTFELYFPGASERVDGTKPANPRPIPWKATGKILLVDDEENVLTVGRRILEKIGFEVIAVSDGTAAVQACKVGAGELRAAIVDLTMPGMDGVETMRALHAACPDLPVFITSGYSESELAKRYAGERMRGFIQKPYAVESIVTCMRRLLEEEPGHVL